MGILVHNNVSPATATSRAQWSGLAAKKKWTQKNIHLKGLKLLRRVSADEDSGLATDESAAMSGDGMVDEASAELRQASEPLLCARICFRRTFHFSGDA